MNRRSFFRTLAGAFVAASLQLRLAEPLKVSLVEFNTYMKNYFANASCEKLVLCGPEFLKALGKYLEN